MNFQTIELKIHLDYSKEELLKKINKKIHIPVKTFEIIRKSLDARGNTPHWLLKIDVNSPPTDFNILSKTLIPITKIQRKKKVVIVGSGPAGLFAGIILIRAGFDVTILERGKEVKERDLDINEIYKTGIINNESNFAFGEGGAGTYSDGKLTSRSKHIKIEKDFILSSMITHGAPREIFSLLHPHVGSDNLKKVVEGIRKEFIDLGGNILFNTQFINFDFSYDNVKNVISSSGFHDCDYLILATGHSATDTYRLLINKGLTFNTKNFALGFRVEHPQALINNALWGVDSLPGVKAGEYRLTSQTDSGSAYSFCMCPGGIIVPAAAKHGSSVVNGMSYYNRDGYFANSAVVTQYNYSKALNREVHALEALDLLQSLEEKYYNVTKSLRVPAMKINDFINSSSGTPIGDTSYQPGVQEMDISELLPRETILPLREGLMDFSRKLKGFNEGNILGLESKTSSPIQVSRTKEGLCQGFNNLYFLGEGSGWAGGIISSGGDGIKGAMDIIRKETGH
jgi:uncharacterized protein